MILLRQSSIIASKISQKYNDMTNVLMNIRQQMSDILHSQLPVLGEMSGVCILFVPVDRWKRQRNSKTRPPIFKWRIFFMTCGVLTCAAELPRSLHISEARNIAPLHNWPRLCLASFVSTSFSRGKANSRLEAA